ncbi:hypothetical protein M3J09_008655 [Ascochyta lentis]
MNAHDSFLSKTGYFDNSSTLGVITACCGSSSALSNDRDRPESECGVMKPRQTCQSHAAGSPHPCPVDVAL